LPESELGGRLQILVVEVSGQRYALRLEEVREVVSAVAITPLAGLLPLFEGVFDLRGSLVPVVELRTRLGLGSKPIAVTDQFIVAEAGERTIALRVDAVDWLREIDPDSIASARELAPDAAFIFGVARLPDGLVVIHDLERFLSPAEADELELALSRAGAAWEGM
jgi:purine-binding chemotaxis protein CheW